jgi:hypothetical protein
VSNRPTQGKGRVVATLAAASVLAACGQRGAPAVPPERPLDPAAQRAAAQQLVRAFAETCLSATEALGATQALISRGWPPFNEVWKLADSAFYSGHSSPDSPVTLFVIDDRKWIGRSLHDLLCVGHYSAADATAMVDAMTQRWGPSQPGRPDISSGARAWAFRRANGALQPTPVSDGAGGPPTAAAIASLRDGEAIVYMEVFYNASLHDVASLVSIQWPAE